MTTPPTQASCRHRRHRLPLWLLFLHLPPQLPPPAPQRHVLRHMAWPRHALRTGCTAPGTAVQHTRRRTPLHTHHQAAQLLRMTHIWAQTTLAVQETTNGLGLLCRLYLCIAWGLLQPWFLWLAVLLCRKAIKCVVQEEQYISVMISCAPNDTSQLMLHSPQPTPRRWSMPCAPCCATRAAAKRSKSEKLSQPESPQGELIAAKRSSDANDTPQPDPPCVCWLASKHGAGSATQRMPLPRKRSDSTGNLSIIGLSLLAALPVAAVQGVVAWMSRMVSGAGWDSDPSSPGHYFFSPYDWGVGAQCPDQLAQNQGYAAL